MTHCPSARACTSAVMWDENPELAIINKTAEINVVRRMFIFPPQTRLDFSGVGRT